MKHKVPPASGPRAETLRIAGYAASWTSIRPEVDIEAGEGTRRLPAETVDLFTLADPERSIDAAALLRETVIADPPYWALVWTGARALAAVSASWKFEKETKVLDLGCGLGLAGLAAAGRGAAVTFGDYLEAPLAFVRATVERLALANCVVRRIDFTSPEREGIAYDLILAADIVYDPAHYLPLACWLDDHLAPGGTILLTESLRADARVFLEILAGHGFADEKQALWVSEDGRRERTWMHRLVRR